MKSNSRRNTKRSYRRRNTKRSYRRRNTKRSYRRRNTKRSHSKKIILKGGRVITVKSVLYNQLKDKGLLEFFSHFINCEKFEKEQNDLFLRFVKGLQTYENLTSLPTPQTEIIEIFKDHYKSREKCSKFKHDVFKQKKPTAPLVGLKNLGNTCYMNSVIQCLRHTYGLTEYMKGVKDLKGSKPLVGAFSNLIKEMQDQNAPKVYDPTALKEQTNKLSDGRFVGYGQEDASEMYSSLLDGLHEEMNRIPVKPPWDELQDIEGEDDKDKSARYWKSYTDVDSSYMVDIFAGQISSELVCSVCKNRKVSFDTTWITGLNLPEDGSQTTLTKCLDAYTSSELLDIDESFRCPQCKSLTIHNKTIKFQRLPLYLSISFKRFSSQSSNKMENVVTFPRGDEMLDMDKYITDNEDSYSYRLYAICNHHGNDINGGHYTTFARNLGDNEWYNYNDSVVNGPHAGTVDVGGTAYMLLYERIDENGDRMRADEDYLLGLGTA